MKVKELKKINEYAENNEISLDYAKLLRYSQNDINKVLNLIYLDNEKVKYVMKFINFCLCNPDWRNDYQHLEEIENFDIREYLIEKISSAYSKFQAEMIFKCFDFEDSASDLQLFHTVEEWKTYIEGLGETINHRSYTVLSNVKKVLEKATDNRCDLIKKVMEYSQRDDFDSRPINEYFDDEILERHLESILSLLLKGYDIESVRKLFDCWDSDGKCETNSDKLIEIHVSYEKAINYLINSKLFSTINDDNELIDIFNNYNFDDYDDIIKLLKEIENGDDKELFQLCLENPFHLDMDYIRDYLREILSEKDGNDDYRSALIYLWENAIMVTEGFYPSEENINLVINTLVSTQTDDNAYASMNMAKFIGSIHHIEMIGNMEITGENTGTRKVLYQEFPKFIYGLSMSENQVNHYKDWLTKLCKLPSDICKKVMAIINIPIIKNMDIEKQNEIKELVLNPENFGSLDYIYTKYKEKEEELNKYHSIKKPIAEPTPKPEPAYNPEVKLVTVLELLNDDDTDINKVLEDFNDEDEITPKTLIRTPL